MKMRKTGTTEREISDELASALSSAFDHAFFEDLNWSNILGLTIYHVSNFCRARSNVQTTELVTMVLYALCLTTLEKTDKENLRDSRKHCSIKLNLPDEIGNDVDGASALILASFEQLFEDLCGVKNALSETRH